MAHNCTTYCDHRWGWEHVPFAVGDFPPSYERLTVTVTDNTNDWPDPEELRWTVTKLQAAINDLFDSGGPDGFPLPESTWSTGTPWLTAVRVEALRQLAKAAGIAE